VEQKLTESGIEKEHIFSEVRGGRDAIYTEVYTSHKEKAHGVFVALYVKKIEKIAEPIEPKRASKAQKVGAPVVKAPALIDSDKDGVADDKDECKGTPAGVSVDLRGCPLKSTLKLNFAVGSDRILENSYSEIERFATFLKANTMYHALITGHTDSVGKAVMNMDLSQRRALSTKNALVKAGVDASRLSTKGRGELDPIASNMLAEGREINRRIEVELLLQK
jgi:OOP family OmpA-OmpF porin